MKIASCLRCQPVDVGAPAPRTSLGCPQSPGRIPLLYAILAYHPEGAVENLNQQQDETIMRGIAAVNESLAAEGIMGPAARLMGTSAAVTLRQRGKVVVHDGPFAESKEALLGFHIVDCPSLEAAIDTGKRLFAPRAGADLPTALEIRPIRFFLQGVRKTS